MWRLGTPTADLNVVNSASLELSCLSHNSWSVMTKREMFVEGGHLGQGGEQGASQ